MHSNLTSDAFWVNFRPELYVATPAAPFSSRRAGNITLSTFYDHMLPHWTWDPEGQYSGPRKIP